jgi:hypothetical protein
MQPSSSVTYMYLLARFNTTPSCFASEQHRIYLDFTFSLRLIQLLLCHDTL